MTMKRSILAVVALLCLASHGRASACAAEPLLGSVCVTAASFCPQGFLEANGQVLPITQHSALYSLLGTTYGGDGRNNFSLPDLRGRVPVGDGAGPGLAGVLLGAQGGSEAVTLTVSQLPSHAHAAELRGTSANGDVDDPSGAVPGRLPRSRVYAAGAASVPMGTSAISVAPAGGGQPVPSRDPYIGLRFCIAIQGVYPTRP